MNFDFLDDGAVQGGGYGVPFNATSYDTGASYGATGFYPQQQQQQYGNVSYGYANQYQGASYAQGPIVSGRGGSSGKHHRRHRHHRHQTTEATTVVADAAQAVPE